MNTHKTVMIVIAVLTIILLLLGPALNIGRGFGLLLLICPLMMFGMMYMMGNDKDNHK